MLLLYILGIRLYNLIISIFALFNNKAKLFINGRKNLFQEIKNQVDSNQKHIWFHFASLGEFEQGRPVLEKLKAVYPKKIVVTFFPLLDTKSEKTMPWLMYFTFRLIPLRMQSDF
nr:glycosyltransferase N-terminal domain-containing protein [Pedobacter agri]